jgi:hypothetical protein
MSFFKSRRNEDGDDENDEDKKIAKKRETMFGQLKHTLSLDKVEVRI